MLTVEATRRWMPRNFLPKSLSFIPFSFLKYQGNVEKPNYSLLSLLYSWRAVTLGRKPTRRTRTYTVHRTVHSVYWNESRQKFSLYSQTDPPDLFSLVSWARMFICSFRETEEDAKNKSTNGRAVTGKATFIECISPTLKQNYAHTNGNDYYAIVLFASVVRALVSFEINLPTGCGLWDENAWQTIDFFRCWLFVTNEMKLFCDSQFSLSDLDAATEWNALSCSPLVTSPLLRH